MNLRLNLSLRLALVLICAAMGLRLGATAQAASSPERAFTAALDSFRGEFYERAEGQLEQFLKEFPTSELVPKAVLVQAQAQIKQRKFDQSIALLNAREAEAGKMVDQFLYWKGEAQFQSGKYAAAAESYGKLAAGFATSPMRLEAAIAEAAARAKLGEWPRVAELLNKPDGSFRQAMRGNTNVVLVAHGLLNLAEAELQQRNYAAAEAALQSINSSQLPAREAWQKQFLLSRSQLGAGRVAEALGSTTNLLALSEAEGGRGLIAESVAFRAGILDQLGRWEEAAAAFSRNLTNAPPEQQRQAMVRIAELALAHNQPETAIQVMGQFLIQFTNAPATNRALALLTLGELHLKEHISLTRSNRTTAASAAGLAGTNHLTEALTNFDRLISGFPTDVVVGKAQLDRGWIFWGEHLNRESVDAFKAAVAGLPPSEDLAIAHFKLADALFVQNDFTNAWQNYSKAAELAARWPALKEALSGQSLYQMLRASLAANDLAGATNALQKILTNFPRTSDGDHGVLLVAQGFSDGNNPDEARTYFQKFLEQYPDSALRPEAELLLARIAEQKSDWPGAVRQYDAWLERYATNHLRPEAEFFQAMANLHLGNDTNAIPALSKFVAQYPANPLAPQAQWSVADYYFRQGNMRDAEIFYADLSQNPKWAKTGIAYRARMMAGQAAFARSSYPDAIGHFTNLTSRADCPPEIWVQAMFAYGGVLKSLKLDATNRQSNYQDAIGVYNLIRDHYPGTESDARAQGEIANSLYLLAAQDETYYPKAVQAFKPVIDLPVAGAAVRSQAQVGLGLTLESWAARKTGDERVALFKQALENYLDVVQGARLQGGEVRDPSWVKEAGLRAAQLLTDSMGEWEQAKKLYERLGELLPALQPAFQKKIAALQERAAAKNN